MSIPQAAKRGKFECKYPYHGLDGKLLFYKVRYQNPKSFGYQLPNGKPGKPDNMDAYLYRMPELNEAIRYAADIWWCAGEKDCERVQRELSGRACATTMHGGEGHPLNDGQAVWFEDYPGMIYLVGDNDVTGWRDIAYKYEALLDVGVDGHQIHIRMANMTGDGADVFDHLEAGFTLKQLRSIKIDKVRQWLEDAGAKLQQDKENRKAAAKGQVRLERWQEALVEHGLQRGSGEDWQCPSPGHDDERASFSVDVGDTGDIVLDCLKCKQEWEGDEDEAALRRDWIDEILEFLGLSWSDIRDSVAELKIPGNDTEAAEWLHERHGADIRWLDTGSTQSSQWVVWDGTRWKPDTDGDVRRWMRELARELVPLAEAQVRASMGKKGAIGFAVSQLKQAKALGNKSRIDAALAEAQTLHPGVTLHQSAFDLDKNALAVANGVLVLGPERAYLAEPDRSQMLLRNTEVPYVPEARSAAWDAFLAKFMPEQDMQDFLARMAGYTLLGGNPNGLMFVFQGETFAGKSTFTEAVSRALGSYAKPFDLGALRGKMNSGGPREDVAAIMHARLARSAEMTGAWELHADQIKRLTGSDEISYRKLWREQVSHTPDFTAWISSNFPPRIKGADKALQLRLVGVPFLHPAERRSDAAKALESMEARTAILAWVVAGYDRYRDKGIDSGTWPSAVAKLTATLRSSLDNEDDFLADMYDEEAGFYVEAGPAMYSDYTTWCLVNGVREPMTAQQFGQAITAKGFPRFKKKIGGVQMWVRYGLKRKTDAQIKGIV